MIPSGYDWNGWLSGLVIAFAKLAAAATAGAVSNLVSSLGSKTEPDFQAVIPAYDRMLAIALLLLGGVVAFALIERLLGGRSGGDWNLIARVMAGVAIGFLGLPLVQLAAGYAALIAQAWDFDYIYRALDLLHRVQDLYSGAAGQPVAVGAALQIALAACISLLLALLVHVELILRAALILVTTTFIPLVAVLGIWPRFAASVAHLFEFLFGLLAAKFVMATAIYVGYAVLLAGIPAGARPEDSILVTGIAILAVAAFGPLLLVQGIRIGHHAAAPVARSWTFGAAGLGWSWGKGAWRLGRQGFLLARQQLASRASSPDTKAVPR